jgi:meso-butanediol dehydrogenase / (S,S)-butanediol dehydrogenase / diacetyl reductase
MSLDRLMGIAGLKVLIVGATPIALAAQALFAEAGAAVQALDIAPTEAAMSEAVAQFVGHHGTIDVLVYAATRIGTYALPTMSAAQWDAIHDTNLRGAFLACREAIPVMQRGGGGSIVAVSTMGSLHPVLKGNAAYGSSKAGLNALIRAIALDHAAEAIRANSVLCGAVPVGDPPSDMQSLGGPATQAGRLLLGMGTPEEAAAAILYLATAAARPITGQTLTLDGGFLIS